MEFKHKSVLLEETIEGLDIKPDGIYVDGTLGGAGHAGEVCRKLSAKGRFIGIDQDQDAIIAASERLAPYKQATIIRSNYCYMVQELAARGIYKVDGILLDLGVSSYQLDNEERGFTYRVDARSICAWTSARRRQPAILSMAMKKKSYTVLFVITVKINLQKILQNILLPPDR